MERKVIVAPLAIPRTRATRAATPSLPLAVPLPSLPAVLRHCCRGRSRGLLLAPQRGPGRRRPLLLLLLLLLLLPILLHLPLLLLLPLLLVPLLLHACCACCAASQRLPFRKGLQVAGAGPPG